MAEQRYRVELAGGAVTVGLATGRAGMPAVVLAHGAGAGMDSPFLGAFQQGLAERGWPAARFNFSYMETGRKVPDPRPRLEACYRAVADSIAARLPDSPGLVLGGKSMGGRIASQIVAAGYPANALVFLGYPLHPPGRLNQLRDAHLYGIRVPMLFLSGTRDAFATPELLEQVTARIGANATLARVDGGDHSFRVPGRKQGDVWGECLGRIDMWLRETNDDL